MKLNAINAKAAPAFGRAFTTQEEKDWAKLQERAKSALGINDTFMICFDSCMPEAVGEDKGIGSSFSPAAKNFTDFATRKFGITGVQYSPQGRLAYESPKSARKNSRPLGEALSAAPFSGTAFALGEHLIDLKQLTTSEYEGILPESAYKKAVLKTNPEKVNYSTLPPLSGAISTAIDAAFKNFEKLPESSPLKTQYNKFVKENKDWLEKEALYDCLEEENGAGVSWKKWKNEIDRGLFSGKFPASQVDDRIKQIKAEHKETFNKTLFTQFVLDKQQKTAKKAYNEQGQKLVGDCLIGFSGKEEWANLEAFAPGKYLGCRADNPNDRKEVEDRCWGIPALDVSKLGTPENLGPAGKLLARKMDMYFQRYDALRIDAAWQLIQPYLHEIIDEGKETERRVPLATQPPGVGAAALNIIDASLKKARPDDYKTYPVNLELLGGPVDFKDPILRNRMQIHHSIYQNPGWGSVAFYKNNGLSEDEFNFGLGTHDDLTLIEISNDKGKLEEQSKVLSKNMNVSLVSLLTDKAQFRATKFGEIFTAKNNFFTVFDAMGEDKRINTQIEDDKDNWTPRVGVNYEEDYHRNVAKGRGLNLPNAYLLALKAKGSGDENLIKLLEKAAGVLGKEQNIYTQADANKKLGEDFSDIA